MKKTMYEAVAFVDYEDDGEEPVLLCEDHYLFANGEQSAERKFLIKNEAALRGVDIEEVTVLVRPFA